MNFEQCLKRLAAEKLFVYDCETSGLSWQHNHVIGHVFSFGPAPDDSFYIPVRHAGGGNIEGCEVPQTADGWRGDPHPLEIEIARILKGRSDFRVLGHNLAFDLRFASRLGIDFGRNLTDSMVNAALIDEYADSFSLDACAARAGVAPKKGQPLYDHLANLFGGKPDKKQMGNLWRTAGDDPLVVDYAKGDGTTTWQLWHKQVEEILRPDDHGRTLEKVWRVENRVIPVLNRMTVRGIRVDENRLHEVKRIAQERLEQAQAALPKDLNTRSGQSKRAYFESHGVTNWPMTAPTTRYPDGLPSFPKEWMALSEAGRLINKVNEYSTLFNLLLTPISENFLHDGRIHPEYNQLRNDDEHGTVTGRLSCSAPNVQQFHKRNKEIGALLRSVFIPDEGMIWGDVDYSQCEPRLLAEYGNLRPLVDGYNAEPPIDAHQAVANQMGIPDDRDKGKTLNQALMLGGGINLVARKLGLPVDQAKRYYDLYFEAMGPDANEPGHLRHLQKRAAAMMRSRGYVVSLLGRRAHLPPPTAKRTGDRSYTAVNRLLQCGNADMLKLKLAEIDEYIFSQGDKINLLTNIHDAFGFQFFEGDRAQYEESKRVMKSFGPSDMIHIKRVPVEVDAKEGTNWSEATYGK